MMYRCPLCHLPLGNQPSGLGCANGHHFDRASEGYVNLLPANRKHSQLPGDDRAMVQARRRFLSAGHYRLLSDALEQQTRQLAPSRVIDIGCGEGHFTAAMATALPAAELYGVDISKYAIKRAAKTFPQAHFCVASNRDLPFADASADLITRLYAPSHAAELKRVLAPGGHLLIVTPGPRHLLSLRRKIYKDVVEHPAAPDIPDNLGEPARQRLTASITLNGDEALDLLQMTPFAWRASPDLKAWLGEQTAFRCELDFIIQLYRAA